MNINEFNKEDLLNALNGCTKKNEVYKNLGFNYINARIDNDIKGRYFEFNIDLIEVLKDAKNEDRECPVCGNIFKCKKADPKKTCSYKCSNTFFRSIKPLDECLIPTGSTCCVCSESNILEVYYLDGNKDNKELDNFIPMCPTHKMYMNTKFRVLIQDDIKEYIKNKVLKI